MYIELAGSHALKDGMSVPDELVALMGTRRTLDAKMMQSQVSIFKVLHFAPVVVVVVVVVVVCGEDVDDK